MGAESNIPKDSQKKSFPTLLELFDQELYSPKLSGIGNGKEELSLSPENEVLSIISFCSSISSLSEPHESKRFKLTHLLCVIQSLKQPLHDRVLSSVISMVSANLFRPLPPPCGAVVGPTFLDDEVIACVPSSTWPQLEIVYEILHWLVINIDPKTLGRHLNNNFLFNLLSLFDSEEPRERENLKTIYHQIYYRLTSYRSFMRKAMTIVLVEYIFETERHNGIAEMLEICGTIINGFAVPLKEEHKIFLKKILIPLHKAKGMQVFHRQLAYCVSQFVQKEPELGGLVIRRILKYWPVANSQKELLLIDELEELVEYMDPKLHRDLALPFCSHITKCFNSLNSQVAERALYVWNSEAFVKMASTAAEQVFPVIIEGMEMNLNSHWCDSVKELTHNVKVILEEVDPILYHRCLQQIQRINKIKQS